MPVRRFVLLIFLVIASAGATVAAAFAAGLASDPSTLLLVPLLLGTAAFLRVVLGRAGG